MDFITLIVLGIILALLGVAWLHGHKSGVESGLSRAFTLPNWFVHKANAVVPGSGDAAQKAANSAGNAVSNAADKVS